MVCLGLRGRRAMESAAIRHALPWVECRSHAQLCIVSDSRADIQNGSWPNKGVGTNGNGTAVNVPVNA